MSKKKTDIGYRFIKARKLMGKTVPEIADEVDRTQATVRNWEHDRAKCTDQHILAYYAKESGLSVEYLMGGEYESESEKMAAELVSLVANEPENKRKKIIIDLLNTYGGIVPDGSYYLLTKKQKKVSLACEVSTNDLHNIIKQVSDLVELWLDQYIVNHTKPSEDAPPLCDPIVADIVE